MSSNLIQADIFFFITAISVIVLTGVLLVLSIHFYRIVRDIREITKIVKKEASLISKDLSEVRQSVRAEGKKLRPLLSFFVNIFSKFRKQKQKSNNINK